VKKGKQKKGRSAGVGSAGPACTTAGDLHGGRKLAMRRNQQPSHDGPTRQYAPAQLPACLLGLLLGHVQPIKVVRHLGVGQDLRLG